MPWSNQTQELLVESILHTQQRRRDIEKDLFVGDATAFDDQFESIDLAFDIAAKFSQAQNTERVADLFEQFELRYKLGRFVHACTHEDIQHVLDPTQIFPDRCSNRFHELDTGCR